MIEMATCNALCSATGFSLKTAEAELQPLGQMTLTAVVDCWSVTKIDEKGQKLYQKIQIEGHTDNVPIVTLQFPSTGSFRQHERLLFYAFLKKSELISVH